MPERNPRMAALEAELTAAWEFASSLSGMQYEEARQMAEDRGYSVEKMMPQTGALTLRLQANRLRCWVDNRDIVTEVRAG